MATTKGIQELANVVDSFLYKTIPEDEDSVFQEVKIKMLQDTMTAEEARMMRTTECVEVTVHGQTTESLTIEGLEKRFEKESGHIRTTIPSTDILEHQWKAGLPLHVTQEDALAEFADEFSQVFTPRMNILQLKEKDIKEQVEKMSDTNIQTLDETVTNIIIIAEAIVVLNTPNPMVRKKMERETRAALLEVDIQSQVAKMMQNFGNILHEGVDREVLFKNKAVKAKWGAILNRRGTIGENKVAAAINQALEDHQGMSVMGIKTDTFLSEFLFKLHLKLTHCNTRNPTTGRITKTNEVEHDNVSTWLEEDTLVFNMIEIKATELRPWAPPDQARRARAAVEHVKAALLQIIRNMLTFKELFPDILN
jgi:hypothetical protein